MEYLRIIAEHNDWLCADIDYRDSVADYIVYCRLDYYGFTEDVEDIYDDKDKRTHIGSITGYLILCNLMEQMDEDAYTVCDDYSGELEMIMSILTNHNKFPTESDVFYINEVNLNDDVFEGIMDNLANTIMKHYHSYPEIIAYYPSPLPYHNDKPLVYQAKEKLAQIIAKDVMSFENKETTDGVQLVLDEEQQNYILGRYNDYNVYPESAKNKQEFERFEEVGFYEYKGKRLLVREYPPDYKR